MDKFTHTIPDSLTAEALKLNLYDLNCVPIDKHLLLYDFVKEAKLVKSAIEIEKHRWYNLDTDIYKFRDKFIGVIHCGDIHSENMSVEDTGKLLTFGLYEEVPDITHKKVCKEL